MIKYKQNFWVKIFLKFWSLIKRSILVNILKALLNFKNNLIIQNFRDRSKKVVHQFENLSIPLNIILFNHQTSNRNEKKNFLTLLSSNNVWLSFVSFHFLVHKFFRRLVDYRLVGSFCSQKQKKNHSCFIVKNKLVNWLEMTGP